MTTEQKLPTTTKPSRGWYVLALALFLLGPLLAILLFFNMLNTPKHIAAFTSPGSSAIVITAPGEYTLWTEVKQTGTTDLKTLPNELKNLQLYFKDPSSGNMIQYTPSPGWHRVKNNTVIYSLGSIDFPKAGTYLVSSTQPTSRNYYLYVHKPSLGNILLGSLLSLFLIVFGLLSGIVIALIVFVKRHTPNKMQEQLKPSDSLNANTWAMLCHLSGFAGYLFPLGNILAPLLIWAFKRHQSPFIDDQGKEAINFQISIAIYYLICMILVLVVIGLVLLPLLALFHIIAMIVAAISASNGKPFRYPLNIRFIR